MYEMCALKQILRTCWCVVRVGGTFLLATLSILSNTRNLIVWKCPVLVSRHVLVVNSNTNCVCCTTSCVHLIVVYISEVTVVQLQFVITVCKNSAVRFGYCTTSVTLCVCVILTGLICQSCPRQFVTPWSLMKHAQSVHALKIYLETEPRLSGITDVSCYSEKKLVSSNKSDVVGSFSAVENSESNAEVLLCTPQQAVGLNGAVTLVLKNSSSTGLQVLPVCDLDAATQDQFNNSELVQSAVCRNFSENFENMPPKEFSGQKKSSSVDDRLEHISGEALQTARPESCMEGMENISAQPAVLEKCCSSVLPKKRKRHMEIKHGSSRKRVPVVSSGPTSIYIDLEPGSEGHSFQASVSHDTVQDPVTLSESESFAMLRPSLRRRSVIIQPGMTFSIPVSHEPLSLAASSFNYPIVADSVSTRDTVSLERESTAEQYLQDSNTVSSKPAAAEAATCQRVVELTTDEQKIGTGESSHDGFNSEERGEVKMLEHKRRRYPTSRPFKCDQCDNAFNQRIHLKKHQSKHTGTVVSVCRYFHISVWYFILL